MAMIHFLQNSFLETEKHIETSFDQEIDKFGKLQSIQQCEQDPNYLEPDYIVPEDSFQSLPDWSEALFSVGNIIVLISSICGNIGALLVLYKSQVSKMSTKLFLVSLAVCDLTLALTSPTVDLSQLLSRYQSWIFGPLLCRLIPFFQTWAVMGVALFLVVIAAERYMYIVRSFKSPTGGRNIYASVIVILIWICSLLLALPNLWYYERQSFWTYIVVNGENVRPRNETCSKYYYICHRSTFDHRNIAYYSVLGVAILIPTICFLFCYISIMIFVRRHVNVMSAATGLSSPQNLIGTEARISRNRKTLRLILCLIFLNLICRLPVWTFIIVTNLKEYPVNTVTLFLLYGFHLLSNINSLINPFVYAIFNDSIRSTRGSNCGGGGGPNHQNLHHHHGGFQGEKEKMSCCNFMTSCCYNKIKSSSSSVEYYLERKVNQSTYDLTKNNSSKYIPSVSTQRFNLSDKNEFAIVPKI